MLTSKDLTWSKDLLCAWSGAVVLRERAPSAKTETIWQPSSHVLHLDTHTTPNRVLLSKHAGDLPSLIAKEGLTEQLRAVFSNMEAIVFCGQNETVEENVSR